MDNKAKRRSKTLESAFLTHAMTDAEFKYPDGLTCTTDRGVLEAKEFVEGNKK